MTEKDETATINDDRTDGKQVGADGAKISFFGDLDPIEKLLCILNLSLYMIGVQATDTETERVSGEMLTYMALSILYFISFSAFFTNAFKLKELIGDEDDDMLELD